MGKDRSSGGGGGSGGDKRGFKGKTGGAKGGFKAKAGFKSKTDGFNKGGSPGAGAKGGKGGSEIKKKPWAGNGGKPDAKKPWTKKPGSKDGDAKPGGKPYKPTGHNKPLVGKKPWKPSNKGDSSKPGGFKRKAPEGADKEAAEATGSSKRRGDLKKERQAHRPDNDTVVRAKELWNKLRERKITEEQRAPLVRELMQLLRGKVYKISMKHDASRVVQSAVTFGSNTDRDLILTELEGHLVELSQLQYAHFIVLKLLQRARGAEEQRRVTKDLRGHVAKLATHSIGARVIQQAMDMLPSARAAQLRAELYGPEHALFADMAFDKAPRNLKQVIALRPDRRAIVLEGVKRTLGKIAQKGLLSFAFAHSLLWEYMSEVNVNSDGGAAIADMVPTVIDGYMALLSTRDGSRAAALCAAYGSAKDRKRMMKGFKGFVGTSLMHRDAYLAVLRLVASVDDTVTCQKSVLAELLVPLPRPVAAAVTGVTASGAAVKPGEGVTAEAWVPKGVARSSGTGEAVVEDDEDGGEFDGMTDEFDGEEGGEGEGDDGDEEGAGDSDQQQDEAEESDIEAGEDEAAAEEETTDAVGAQGDADTSAQAALESKDAAATPGDADADASAAPALLPVSLHRNGCKLLLYLAAPDATKYLDPEERHLLEPAMVPVAQGEGEAPVLVCASKKDPEVRRQELLAFLKAPLQSLCQEHTAELMRSKFAGANVLLEVTKNLRTPDLVAAIAAAAVAVPEEGHLAMQEDPAGHLFMKQLLLWEGEQQQQSAAAAAGWFADALLKRLQAGDGGGLRGWAGSNRGAFVLAALAGVPSAGAAVRKALKGRTPPAEGGKGAEVLAAALASDAAAPAPALKLPAAASKASATAAGAVAAKGKGGSAAASAPATTKVRGRKRQ
ncbi:armadillo-type protein [Tribonema minus]|uniref:Armadillo-type protein n=1 Tax=Tribonema minus TaxID=303371 RepID=A0A835Z7T9_9STRA|nr:armadillo-type protein [Tribonema minus]